MGDEGMDPCECFWSHEAAMHRLLSLLRQSQAVCNDSECFDEISGVAGLPRASEDNVMLMFMIWVAFAVFMFMMRPRSVRIKSGAGYRDNEGDDGRPPLPPPAVN